MIVVDYRKCSKWEEVDHDLEDSVAGALLSPSSNNDAEGDPLGIGSAVKCVVESYPRV